MQEQRCKFCQNSFLPSSREQAFCSAPCGNLSRRGKPSWNKGLSHTKEHRKNLSLSHLGKPAPWNKGSLNHFWKGGRTSVIMSVRASAVYKNWRSEVMARDNFTCQICMKTSKELSKESKKLNVDHVKRFADIMRDNGISTFEQAINCIEVWDMNNARTLCEDCHRKTDTFGIKPHIRQIRLRKSV